MKLSDIAMIRAGCVASKVENKYGDEVDVILPSYLINNRIEFLDEKPTRWHKQSKKGNVNIPITKENDILIKASGGGIDNKPLNKPLEVVLIDKEQSGYSFTNSIYLVRCNNSKDARYIFSYLCNINIQNKLINKTKINTNALKNLQIQEMEEDIKSRIIELNLNMIRQRQILSDLDRNITDAVSKLIYSFYKEDRQ